MSRRKKKSKCLVVDADIARAAGGMDAIAPTPKNCRDFLLGVMTICHRVAMSKKIRNEWDHHKSSFTSNWLNKMFGSGKVVKINPSSNGLIQAKIEELDASEKDRKDMIKDLHLLEAALASDRIVISMDKRAKDLFSFASMTIGEIRPIIWVNPDLVDDDPILWLEHGAKAERPRMLGFKDET